MNYLRRFSGSTFSDLMHDNPIAYFIRPLHGETLKSDFSVDIREKNGAYLVHAELPGVKKEDVNVSIENDCFTISAEINQYDQKADDERIIQSERYFGSLSRTIRLPMQIDKGASSAHFENGVLELTLTKAKKINGKKLEIK